MRHPKRLFIILAVVLLGSLLRLAWLDRIDISADEDHYISESQRWLRGDPYISVRHHPFQHPKPNIGHPFLAQLLSAEIYQAVGFSVWSARLPSAFVGVLTLILIFLFRGELGGRVSVYGGLLLALIPFAVRFNRDAHLDSFLTLWVTLVAFCLWSWHTSLKKDKLWLIGAGVAVGFSISTKLDGIIALILSGVLLWVVERRLINWLRLFLYIIIPAGLVAIVLNDPKAYFDGIINPADPSFSLYSSDFWKAAFFSLISFWPGVFFALLSPLVVVGWLVSFIWLATRQNIAERFLLWWQGILLLLFVFHRPSVSGEYGLLPVIPALLMSLSYFMIQAWKSRKMFSRIVVFTLPVVVLPYTIWYGLRFKPVEYYPRDYVMNRRTGDAFFADMIKTINTVAPKNGKIFFLPQGNYPFFALREDLSWSYHGDLTNFDVIVVEDPKIVESLSGLRLFNKVEGRQDGMELTRFIYVKKT